MAGRCEGCRPAFLFRGVLERIPNRAIGPGRHYGQQITGRALEFCRRFSNQREVTVKGIHYVQEDSPAEIGGALREFVGDVRK